MTMRGRALTAGQGAGAIVTTEPLSFWGGYDPASGTVMDRSHPACGQSLKGVVLAMRCGRGSSSSSTVLAEAIRLETAPSAILLAESDPILVVGVLVAEALYGRQLPIVVLAEADFAHAIAAGFAEVDAASGMGSVVLSALR